MAFSVMNCKSFLGSKTIKQHVWNERRKKHKDERNQHITAAIDGMSDWPGEPCETSIPIIMVGTLDIKGIEGEPSTDSSEFSPPSCK